MDQPILTKKTLKNYLIVDKPCTAECTVSATVNPEHLINGTEPYYILYLRVLRETDYHTILEKLEEVSYISFLDNKKLFLSGILFQDQIKKGFDLPSKGEIVIVNFDYKNDILSVTNIELKPRYQLKRIDITEIYPLLNLFKKYFNDKSNNESSVSSNENMSIPKL